MFEILTEGILGYDSVFSFQRFRFAFSIHSANSELVFLTRYQIFHYHSRFLRASHWNPPSCFRVHFLDHIMIQRRATIIQGWTPFQCASFFVHVGYFKRAFWFARFVQDQNLDRRFIFSRAVLCFQRQRASVGSASGRYQELGFVIFQFDGHHASRLLLGFVQEPCFRWRWFTGNFHV